MEPSPSVVASRIRPLLFASGEAIRRNQCGEARFVTTGFHVREHGGPIREGEPVDSVPATYLGSVVGDRMTLRAVAGTDTLGPFVLQRDATPQLYKCL